MIRTWPISPQWTTPKVTPSARTPIARRSVIPACNVQYDFVVAFGTPSEAAGPGDEQVIEDLVDTLEANRSRCVGMAANMIGVGKRIIVFVDEDLGGA